MSTDDKKLVVVLDINGVLFFRDSELKHMVPSAVELIKWLNIHSDKFDYGVWSSKHAHNVEKYVQRIQTLLPEFKPLFKFSRDHCLVGKQWTDVPFGTIKNLNRLWNAFPNHSWAKHGSSRTIAIDDTADKYLHQLECLALVDHGCDLEAQGENMIDCVKRCYEAKFGNIQW